VSDGRTEGSMTANISSVASTLTPPTGSVYNATKATVDAITKTLGKELASRVRASAIFDR
jgi:3-oxoacyl-[acyl-carrier protein] reductase